MAYPTYNYGNIGISNSIQQLVDGGEEARERLLKRFGVSFEEKQRPIKEHVCMTSIGNGYC